MLFVEVRGIADSTLFNDLDWVHLIVMLLELSVFDELIAVGFRTDDASLTTLLKMLLYPVQG